MHSSRKEGKKTLENHWWSYCHNLQTRQTKQLQSCFQRSICIFQRWTVPTFTVIFQLSYLLHPEGHRGARRGCSAGRLHWSPEEKPGSAIEQSSKHSFGLCLRLSAPPSSFQLQLFMWWRNTIASSPNLTISRQCRRRQCLRNSNSLEYRGWRLKRDIRG